MNKRTFILPYRMGSRSTVALSRAINALIIRRTGSKYQPMPGDRIINWGNVRPVEQFDFTLNTDDGFLPEDIEILNDPEKVAFVSNKRKFFHSQKDAGNGDIVPRFWLEKGSVPDDAFPVVCRTVLSGHSGSGIVIANKRSDLVDSRLFVEYVKKMEEYRVHCGRMKDGQSIIIAIQRKARKLDVPDEKINWQIRTHSNGFVFVRKDLETPWPVKDAAQRVFETSGLDFGAVDVVYNEKSGRAFALEINSAPGLEGTTVTDYASFFLQRRFGNELV